MYIRGLILRNFAELAEAVPIGMGAAPETLTLSFSEHYTYTCKLFHYTPPTPLYEVYRGYIVFAFSVIVLPRYEV